MAPITSPEAPFGRVLTAMVTPMTSDGAVDYDGAAELATYLVDTMSNDGLVINGTTGESPTTTDAEKERLLSVVLDAVGNRATVVAGVGTNDTHHVVELAKAAERVGAHGVLVVSPYYNKPPQNGLLRHFTTVADATGLPMMTYDIPGRTNVAIATDTLVRLAEHPRIVANKDAKADLEASSWVMARSGLAYYSGMDDLNLPLLSIGGVGFVSVAGHVVGSDLREMLEAYLGGDVRRARDIHLRALSVFTGLFRTSSPVLTKAALNILGLPAGTLRSPLVEATPEQVAQLREDLAAAGVAAREVARA